MKAMDLLMKNFSRYKERPVCRQVCLAARVQGRGPEGMVSGGEALSQLGFPTDHCVLLGENQAQQNWKGAGEGVNKEVRVSKAGKLYPSLV